MTAIEMAKKLEQLQAIEQALAAQYGNGEVNYDVGRDVIEVTVRRGLCAIMGTFLPDRQSVRWLHWFVDTRSEDATQLPIKAHSEAILNAAPSQPEAAPSPEPSPPTGPIILGEDKGRWSITAQTTSQGGISIELPCSLSAIHLTHDDVRAIARLANTGGQDS